MKAPTYFFINPEFEKLRKIDIKNLSYYMKCERTVKDMAMLFRLDLVNEGEERMSVIQMLPYPKTYMLRNEIELYKGCSIFLSILYNRVSHIHCPI